MAIGRPLARASAPSHAAVEGGHERRALTARGDVGGTRRSESTGAPTRSAIHAGSPSCRVPRACPDSTQWKTVWPCETMRSGTTPDRAPCPAPRHPRTPGRGACRASQKPPARQRLARRHREDARRGASADHADGLGVQHAQAARPAARRHRRSRRSRRRRRRCRRRRCPTAARARSCRPSCRVPAASEFARGLGGEAARGPRVHGREGERAAGHADVDDDRRRVARAASCSMTRSRWGLCAPTASTSTTNGSRAGGIGGIATAAQAGDRGPAVRRARGRPVSRRRRSRASPSTAMVERPRTSSTVRGPADAGITPSTEIAARATDAGPTIRPHPLVPQRTALLAGESPTGERFAERAHARRGARARRRAACRRRARRRSRAAPRGSRVRPGRARRSAPGLRGLPMQSRSAPASSACTAPGPAPTVSRTAAMSSASVTMTPVEAHGAQAAQDDRVERRGRRRPTRARRCAPVITAWRRPRRSPPGTAAGARARARRARS